MVKHSHPMLPIIQNCDGCGACCFEQGSPPGYLWLLQLDAAARSSWPDEEDAARIDEIPADALAVIQDYARKLGSGEVSGEGACCWLDQQTLRCRWYDHRPQICRDFEVGSEACRTWRNEYNVDLEALGLNG